MRLSEVRSFSVVALARIELASELVLLRNRGTYDMTGKIVYSPVGGAMSMPVGHRLPESILAFQPVAEREPKGGTVDIRYRLGAPVRNSNELLMLTQGITELLGNLPLTYIDPVREVVEELVDEEAIVPAHLLQAAAISASFSHTSIAVAPDRNDREGRPRLHRYDVYDVRLPDQAMEALGERYRSGDEVVLLASREEIAQDTRGRYAAPVTQALLQ